jgi:hypothetical protein
VSVEHGNLAYGNKPLILAAVCIGTYLRWDAADAAKSNEPISAWAQNLYEHKLNQHVLRNAA